MRAQLGRQTWQGGEALPFLKLALIEHYKKTLENLSFQSPFLFLPIPPELLTLLLIGRWAATYCNEHRIISAFEITSICKDRDLHKLHLLFHVQRLEIS